MPTQRKTSSEKGIALFMVLMAVVILSGIALTLYRLTLIDRFVSENQTHRFEAYFLAQSGLRLSKLLIRYDPEVLKIFKRMGIQSDKHIYTQPISTRYFRDRLGEGGANAFVEASAEGEAADSGSVSGTSEVSEGEKETIKDFLDFRGDFVSLVQLMDGQFPLGAFYRLDPKSPEAIALRRLLTSLLLQKTFEPFFEDQKTDAEKLAIRIADFVDDNSVRNELDGSEAGIEDSPDDQKTHLKNTRLLSVDQLIFVSGMTQELLEALKKEVTIYRSVPKINICRTGASEDLRKAFILAYYQTLEDVPPLSVDDEERMAELIDLIDTACPDFAKLLASLDEALGVSPSRATPSPAGGNRPRGAAAETQGASGQPVSLKEGFMRILGADETLLKIDSIGLSGKARFHLVNVIDVSEKNPSRWKDMFFGVAE